MPALAVKLLICCVWAPMNLKSSSKYLPVRWGGTQKEFYVDDGGYDGKRTAATGFYSSFTGINGPGHRERRFQREGWCLYARWMKTGVFTLDGDNQKDWSNHFLSLYVKFSFDVQPKQRWVINRSEQKGTDVSIEILYDSDRPQLSKKPFPRLLSHPTLGGIRRAKKQQESAFFGIHVAEEKRDRLDQAMLTQELRKKKAVAEDVSVSEDEDDLYLDPEETGRFGIQRAEEKARQNLYSDCVAQSLQDTQKKESATSTLLKKQIESMKMDQEIYEDKVRKHFNQMEYDRKQERQAHVHDSAAQIRSILESTEEEDRVNLDKTMLEDWQMYARDDITSMEENNRSGLNRAMDAEHAFIHTLLRQQADEIESTEENQGTLRQRLIDMERGRNPIMQEQLEASEIQMRSVAELREELDRSVLKHGMRERDTVTDDVLHAADEVEEMEVWH